MAAGGLLNVFVDEEELPPFATRKRGCANDDHIGGSRGGSGGTCLPRPLKCALDPLIATWVPNNVFVFVMTHLTFWRSHTFIFHPFRPRLKQL